MMPWTVDQLLLSTRFRAGLPSDNADQQFTDANLLQLCNEEAVSWLTPLELEMRQEYLIASVFYPLANAAGQQNNFYIPSQAVGNRVRLVRMCDGQKNPIGPQIEQIDPKDVRNIWIPGIWGSFYIQDNALILIGNLPQGYFLRVDYELRLSTLVSATACAQITNIVGDVVTCGGGLPGTFVNGALLDFVAGGSPFTLLGTLTCPTPVGNTLTFSSPPPSAQGRAAQIGDWLAISGTSPFIGLPQEVFPMFAQYMATKCQEIKGDQKIEVTEAKLAQVKRQVKGILAPRALGNRKAPGSMLGQIVGPGIWGWPSGGF
jgi:hypothetical protein